MLYWAYVEHVMFGIVHDMGREGVEGEEVSYYLFLFVVHHLSPAQHKCVYYLIPRQKEMLYLLLGEMESHYEFSTFIYFYERPSLSSLETPNTSFFVIGRNSGIVNYWGTL